MEGTCKGCKRWEEKMYWEHFLPVHFFRVLDSSTEQMIIPKKFIDNLKEKLPENVSLKGPSGSTWNVSVTMIGDTMVFKDGWEEFVNDHYLGVDDILIFRYHGGSRFDVLMFDQQSLCEKESSYFVRKCDHTDLDDACLIKEKTDHFVEAVPETVVDATICPPKRKRPKNDSLPQASSGEKYASRVVNKIRRKSCLLTTRRAQRRSISTPIRSQDAELITVDLDEEPTPATKIAPYQLHQYLSNRRAVTEEEKERALKNAHAAASDEGFVAVMRPTHVYKRFFVAIPPDWLHSRLGRQNQSIVLRFNGNTWSAKFYNYKSHSSSGISGGWKNFALENNLEEFDVCVLEPVGKEDDAFVIDVSIFRVVDELTPLTPARSQAGK